MEQFTMPELEFLKFASQLGGTGLLAIFVVWCLFYGAPMLRDTLKYFADQIVLAAAKNDSSVNKIVKMFEEYRAEQSQQNHEERENCRRSRHEGRNDLQKLVVEMSTQMRDAVKSELKDSGCGDGSCDKRKPLN